MKQNRILKCLLVVASILCTCSMWGADYDFRVDHIYYSIISETNYTVEVVDFSGNDSGVLDIPDVVDYNGQAYSVVSIGSRAFSYTSAITSVSIGNNVTTIGNSAFYHCSNLATITFGSSVTTIGDNAFWYCSELTSVTIPNSVITIGDDAFRCCSSLKTLIIGSNVTSIGNFAFEDCSALTSVTIPNSVTSMGMYAFYNCTGLASVSIGDKVETIDIYTFYRCTNLATLYIGSSVTTIGNYAFYYCSELTSVTIPNSVTTIGSDVFDACTKLKNLTIGNNVTSIGSCAFYNTSITELTIPQSVTTIGSRAFYNCSNLSNITLENGEETLTMSTSSSNTPFTNCSSIETIYLGRDVSYTDSYSPFRDKTTLSALTIGNNVTFIGDYAFSGCTGITSLTIPSSVTSLGSAAFANCTMISNLTIEDGKEELVLKKADVFEACPIEMLYLGRNLSFDDGNNVFRENILLTSLVIGSGVTQIEDYSFYKCTGLNELTIENGATTIGSYAFCGCSNIKEVTIPSSVTSIGNLAFSGCTNLTTISMDDSYGSLNLTSSDVFEKCPITTLYLGRDISYESDYPPFKDCTTLISLTIGNSATKIDNYSFYGCIGMSSLIIGSDVETIGDYAFASCAELTKVVIPNSTTTIGNYSFNECSSLKDLTIGSSVENIKSYAFAKCVKLTDVVIPNSTTTIEAYSFNGCSALQDLTIGSGVTYIASSAFGSCSKLDGATILADTPPEVDGTLSWEEIDVPYESLTQYAKSTYWTNIPIIYSIKNGTTYYPALISSEGNFIIKAHSGDEYSAVVAEGKDITIYPILAKDEFLGRVVYGGKNVTATIIGEGEYSFAIDKYHENNIVYSYYVDSDEEFDVSLAQSGTLADLVGVNNINNVRSLRVSGDLNGSDILAIRKYPNLEFLDMTYANIVRGGSAYYNTYETYYDEIGDYFFYNLTALSLLKLPDSATSIGNYAFSGCSNLGCINLSSSASSITSDAFQGCKKIEGINAKNATPPEITSGNSNSMKGKPFSDIDVNNCVLNVPIGSGSAYWLDTYWGVFFDINEVDFDHDTTGIDDILASDETSTLGGDIQIYDISGRRVNTPIKGNVYIFRYPDSTTKKIIVE